MTNYQTNGSGLTIVSAFTEAISATNSVSTVAIPNSVSASPSISTSYNYEINSAQQTFTFSL